MIIPEDLIKNHSVEYFRQKAEEYFANLPLSEIQLGKPFSDPKEAPGNIYHLGLLLAGLKLGKALRVLDFGAGTCWLSRFLNQLGCTTVSVDISQSALDLGKRLFREYPIVGKLLDEPQFVLSDGQTIPMGDQSVDRIVCFDALHHVPNQEAVLKELCRILKNGGIAGFAEPGKHHSKTTGAQYEMANYGLLENDIILESIWEKAKNAGFTDIAVVPVLPIEFSISLEEYSELVEKRHVSEKISESFAASASSSSVFFLMKGKTVYDSRIPFGLKYDMVIDPSQYSFKINRPAKILCRIQNTGAAIWIHRTPWGIGNVKIGIHLYDANKKLIDLDFFRARFDHDIQPGETVSQSIDIVLDKREVFYLGIDLVSEAVAWFEQLGNTPLMIKMIPD
jgi:ubiquinone/menaquinone biosynthesis C-methylase UbiE